LLAASGKSVVTYHAGLSTEERRAAEARIREQLPDVIVATQAFGMGMDYPALEWVLLWQAPSSLLSFAQTIGRVGRNFNQRARALALWDDEDFRLLEWTLQGSSRRQRQLELTHQYLNTSQCRRKSLRDYFRGTLSASPHSCGLCDFCRGSGLSGHTLVQ
jgi:ATP-dependent DNA helicase RecQ